MQSIERRLVDGTSERLDLSKGLNLLAGPPNTGKSVWLRMIDYLLGEPRRFADRFDTDITHKYSSLEGSIVLAEDTLSISRSWWPQTTSSTPIRINGVLTPVERLQEVIMSRLGIPLLYYPRSGPLSETWTILSWRTLMRHLYRRQPFWNDLADKQYPIESAACVLQFLGAAELLFSSERPENNSIQKQIALMAAEQNTIKHSVLSYGSTYLGSNLGNIDNLGAVIASRLAEAQRSAQEVAEDGRRLKELQNPSNLDELLKLAFMRGRLVERARALRALDQLVQRIDELKKLIEQKEQDLSANLAALTREQDTARAQSTLKKLAEGMNSYLAKLNELQSGTWSHARIHLESRRGYVNFRIGDLPWATVLGGTDSLYFLMSYHFGLMSLSADANAHFPGFSMLDLPADFQGHGIATSERLILTPFLELFSKPEYKDCQLIIATNSSDALPGAKIVSFTKPYLAHTSGQL